MWVLNIESVLTSSHNLFYVLVRATIRENVWVLYPCKSQFYYIKVGVEGGGGLNYTAVL